MIAVLLKIRYILVLPLLILSLLTTPVAVSTDSAELIGDDMFVFDQALMMGQGITTDGEYFYTSGAIAALNLTFLAKFDADNLMFVDAKMNPLPDVCSDRGNNHIGGISYYEGKIYASVEGPDEGFPCIAVFDCETLKATGEVYDLDIENYDDGVPWCAVDRETGLLYASKWSDAETIYVYDIAKSMELVREIPLTGIGVIDRIQGGEFYNGTLFLSNDLDNGGFIKNILSVNIQTGEVAVAAERNVGGDNVEAEGMTFSETEDGLILHVLDYNKLIGVNMRHYNVNF
ncbi:MAG: hypothetical protein E7573_03640 [Ruminococcaceae bacterium]|nr:hypothetical protein [Oscillospiraceae bacterium]MBR3596897.1 hypothetical protein [Clostridia bacterium]